MPFRQPISQIIRARYSCRTYDERPIEKSTRQQLAEFAASNTTGPFGTQARFELAAASPEDRAALKGLGTYGFIKDATGFIIGATRDAGGNLEDYGYLMERIVLFATDLGLGTCWLGGSFAKSSFSAKISAREDELVPAVTAVGYIAERPRAMDSMIRRGAGSDSRLPWQRLFFEGQLGTPLSREAAGAHGEILEMVRLGPSASNKQPWRIVKDGSAWHFFLQRTRGYGQGRLRKGWIVADMQRLDMGIAMCHFELSAQELGLGGHWEFDEPPIHKPDELTEYTASWVG
ncbi:MAG TPA: nitroreductase family protein [Anaerolineae bacterium]|nr:nitroreductase family protein [Anaerolineae bacterium]